jgi:hypothetical protein
MRAERQAIAQRGSEAPADLALQECVLEGLERVQAGASVMTGRGGARALRPPCRAACLPWRAAVALCRSAARALNQTRPVQHPTQTPTQFR